MKKKNIIYACVTCIMLAFAVVCFANVSEKTVFGKTFGDYFIYDARALKHACDVLGEAATIQDQVNRMNNNLSYASSEDFIEAINAGYFASYIDTLKAYGFIPADFVASGTSSNNSSTGSGSTKSSAPKAPTLTEGDPSTYVTIREAEVYDGYNGGKKTGATVAPDVEVTVTASSSNGYLRLEDGTFVESGALVSKEEYDAAWTVTEEVSATCTEDGYVKKTNSLSGKETEETLEALGHDYVMIDYLDSTCVDAGYDTYACNRCGDEYTEELEALGHDSGEPVVTVEPKAFSKGVRTTYCTVCGEVVSEETISQTFPIPLWGVVVIAVLVVGGITTGVVFIVKKHK